MNELEKFQSEKEANIKKMGIDPQYQKLGIDFLLKTSSVKYSYNFTWMGRPIIAYPQDMIAMQEVIWDLKPDLIIETGVAHGGSIVYYASLFELIGNDGLVLGIDIDIRKHNRDMIENHPMSKRIKLIEGSSISDNVMNKVHEIASTHKRILVCLDSNHTHEHVLQELNLYAPLVTVGSYCVVFDTVVEDMADSFSWENRSWGKGNNPKTAVWKFLETHDEFEIDASIHNKLIVTVAPDGFLRKIR